MILSAVGWAIVQSLWQWTLVAGVAALLLAAMHAARAEVRYAVACVALLVMLSLTGLTLTTPPALAEPVRMRTLYAWQGLLMIPGIDASGQATTRVVALIWLGGVIAGAARLVHEWWQLRRMRAWRDPAADHTVQHMAAELQRRIGPSKAVPVQCSALAAVPMVVGFVQPRILLPRHATALLTGDQLRAVLAHELAHVRRGDIIVNLFQVLADLAMFHHPAARWLSRRIRTEREYACDDVAVALSGDARGYARALSLLEDARSGSGLVVAAAAGTLLDRVHRVLAQPRKVLTPLRGVLAMITALIVALGLFALAANVPPPWVPAGARLRRPGPPPAVMERTPNTLPRQPRSLGS